MVLIAPANAKKKSKPDDEKTWNIESPYGATHTWKTTLDEGTWLSVDVHPSGDRIVFDLLGDLFVLPMEGGKAKALTTGPAWDHNPRFSPDGNSLMYTSDKGGNQEIWIRDLETDASKALTTGAPERFTEAVWHPDGQHIVARKRITDTRSIGMTELWLFNIEGGDGVQLTATGERPVPSEPTFSNDGKTLYFSNTPWRFQYDRNPHHGIFDLHALDMESGEVRRLTGEAGGAVNPTVHPASNEIAIWTRDGTETAIDLLNLEDGSRTRLHDDVEHDNQEGFALNRLYPRADWTPDGQALITWKAGKIVRIGRDGKAREIPFEASIKHRIHNILRFTERVGTDATVQSNQVRFASLAPDGQTVVFEALGRLWTQDVKASTATPLTDEKHRAFGPAWHPDGNQLLYATWHDEKGGSVRLRNLDEDSEQILTTTAAQYQRPSFSPDGTEVLWYRGSGAPSRGHSTGAELWWDLERKSLSAESAPTRIKTVGWPSRVRWSADGKRLLYVDNESRNVAHSAPKTVLKSTDLNGRDERVIARWERALDAVISPNGTAVAFIEEHRVYKAPIPLTAGKALNLGPESGAVPVADLSDGPGTWLDWTGETPSWTVGPTIYTPKSATQLNAQLPAYTGTKTIAYTGARIHTMGPKGTLENATLLVKSGRIVKVGAVAVPEDAEVIDASGKTIIPGLIDVHAHLHFGRSDAHPQQSWQHAVNLAFGVTTVHDPSANNDFVFPIAERIAAGLEKGPRVYSTGSVLYGAKSRTRSRIKDFEDAKLHIKRMKAMGARSIKSYQQPAREQRQWLIKAASEESINVYPEGGGDLQMNLNMLLDGHTGIEHALPQAVLYADVLGLYAASGAGYSPTLLVAYGGVSGEAYYFQKHNPLNNPLVQAWVPAEQRARMLRRRDLFVADGDWHHRKASKAAAALADTGVPVLLGSHGQMQGIGTHWELWALADGHAEDGMRKAVKAGTIDAAWYLGLEEDLGSIEPGKIADAVILSDDLFENPQNSLSIEEIMKDGIRYDPKTLETPK